MYSPVRIILFVAGALCLAAPTSPAHAGESYEHVANGGFEDGVAPWSARPGSAVSAVAGGAKGGSMSALVESAEAPPSIRQSLPGLTAAGHYVLNGAVRGVAGAGAMSIDATIRLNSHEMFQFQIEADGDWTTFTGEFSLSTPTSGATLTLAARSSGASFSVDTVTLTGPPPAPPTPAPTLTPVAVSTIAGGPTPLASASSVATASPITTPREADVIAAHLRNADFETSGAEGPASWAKYGGVLSSVDAPVHGGAHAARLESNTSSTKWLYQTVLVDPGASYAFAAWLRIDDPGVSAAWLRVSWYASTDGSGASQSSVDSTTRLDSQSTSWHNLTTESITAPSNAHSARLRVMLAPASPAPAATYVDEATWAPAPPPVPTPVPPPAVADSADESEAHGAPSAATAGSHAGAARIIQSTASGGHGVVINEVAYDPDGEGPDAANEWVELYNSGTVAVDFKGWTLEDTVSADVLPAIILGPQSFLIIAASDRFSNTHADFAGSLVDAGGRIGNGLNNDGDRLTLFDAAGNPVDAVSWGEDDSALQPPVGDVPAGHSIERRTPGVDSNSASDFVDNESPTPGRAIDLSQTKAPARSAGSIEVLRASPQGRFNWMPWAVAAISAAALAGTLGWRAWGFARARTPAP